MNYNNSPNKLSTELLYSKESAARVTGIPGKKIARVEVWWKVIFVVFKKGYGLRPRFVSKKDFWVNFDNFRSGNIADLELHPNPHGGLDHGEDGRFAVVNPKTDGLYVVTLKEGNFHCTCKDFEKQEIARDSLSLEKGKMHTPRCKHIHRVLALGDYESLKGLHHCDGEPLEVNWAETAWLYDSDYSQVPVGW